jgi:hypothetical protein
MEELNINQGIIVSFEEEEQIKINGKVIKIAPFYKWASNLS